MIIQKINDIEFKMSEPCDFSFLEKHGKVFCAFDENDSGNISFGTDNGQEKYFIKVAGAKTLNSGYKPDEAIQNLKNAVPVYKDLKHPNLVELIDDYAAGNLYAAVFRWVDGECLHDHWNFEKYKKNPQMKSPKIRFKELPALKRIDSFNIFFSFLIHTASKGYIAVDFYDGSILYDFEKERTAICDIDYFAKAPVINHMGDFWGTKRLKSPEEYILGAEINEETNVYTLGALIFHFFGEYTDDDIQQMYKNNCFFPCSPEKWELNERLYDTALKAVNNDRIKRYDSISDFFNAWNRYPNPSLKAF
ncbi:MAG: hypothetical protein FWG44_08150 [Oscillospiraceae bacterium]|nr:hypothetical protein [Oscillospiraceae bacterium]